MTKTLLLSVFMALICSSAFAGQTSGLCEKTAIKHALESAPGIDPESPATLTAIRLVKTKVTGASIKIESYYVQTEDQGGPAASIIFIRAIEKQDGRRTHLTCEVINQKWVE